MKYYIFLIIAIASSMAATSQNIRIVGQSAFVPADSTVQKMKALHVDIQSILNDNTFSHITYLSDGLRVKGYMAIPKKAGKYPVVIYNRGGNLEFGKLTDDGFFSRGLAEIAHSGYIILASQYRGNDGGEGKEEFGGSDVNDVLNLIPLAATLAQADTSRIGMFGWSRGGMMTYLALSKSKKIKAAVVGSGISDLVQLLETRPEFNTKVFPMLIPDYKANKISALQSRSAVYFADRINKKTPLLILHGTADWRVPASQTLGLVEKLYQGKQPFRFVLYEGGEHALIEHRTDYVAQTTNWFNTYLRDLKPWPSLELHGD